MAQQLDVHSSELDPSDVDLRAHTEGQQRELKAGQLSGIPVFRGFSPADLNKLRGQFERVDAVSGEALFDEDQAADAIYLLVEGDLTLFQGQEPISQLRPPALIGELGGLTGQKRNSRAVPGPGAVLWRLRTQALHSFFSVEPAIGLRFQQNLLELAADKIKRDQTRVQDMRQNLIRTQKAMKRMRDFLLESQDTVVSRPLHEILDGLIKQNRRVNYRVEPPPSLPAWFRLDGLPDATVVQISRSHISFRLDGGELPASGARLIGVLHLSGPEIPICGKVLRTIGARVDFRLDLLIEEYEAMLEGYLTRVQLLDFLV